ncbi:accessory factor UbiK family protein [Thalassolituus sp.]|jgi:BMFP domain-containing protein YqiC|uniref:accessory factor UbiK family protein n=1 Tax=Thalassolituus sp. TaxID=2030822 RepID=UPI00263A052E|nr:accessory factor UbiK family protein [uncultured Thalassolituus sp.]
MMKPEAIRSKVEQMLQQTPFAGLSSDIKLALQSQLQSLITNANLVTREEFEVQSEVLRRTNARLAELEERLAKLEAE